MTFVIGFVFALGILRQILGECPPVGRVSSKVDDVYYWLPNGEISFPEANNLCQRNGMILANVSTFDKLNQVLQTAAGFTALWVGMYSPQFDWLSCKNESCHRYIYDIQGHPLSFYELGVPTMADTTSMCLQLTSSGNISSQDCQKLLQAVCEIDCSPRDKCSIPDPSMYLQDGRWSVAFSNESSQSFEEARTKCLNLNSNLVMAKSLRDNWILNGLSKNKGGPNHEVYIGLDPSSLTQVCLPWDGCPGLKWLDGTPYEMNAVHWTLTTNGSDAVECFIFKHFQESSIDTYKIIGVNDCHQKRAFACVSQCSRQRCSIPPTLNNSLKSWNFHYHRENDKVV